MSCSFCEEGTCMGLSPKNGWDFIPKNFQDSYLFLTGFTLFSELP